MTLEDLENEEEMTLEDEAEPEAEELEAEEEAGDEEEEGEGESEAEAEAEGLSITIGDEDPEAEEEEPAPVWVKELRKTARSVTKENKELKKKLEALENPAPKDVPLREKPTLESHDYDTDKYDQDLMAWYEQKQRKDAQKREEEAAQASKAEAWNQKLTAYGAKRDELDVPDFEDAEGEVMEALSQTQQGIIVQGAENPALVIYALGKNPKRIKALAEETDPVKFAFAVAKLEKDLKVSKGKKKPPAPERRPKGSATGASGGSEKALERLMQEADKTGDYTEYYKYKRKLERS